MDMLKRKQPKSSALLLPTPARKSGRVLLSAALIFGLVASFPGVSHAARDKSCPGIHKRGKNWTGIELPEKAGDRHNFYSPVEIDPMDPQRIFLTYLREESTVSTENPFGGRGVREFDVILGSTDGGCSWKTVLDMEERSLALEDLDPLRDSLPPEEIRQVIAASDKSRERLYVVTHSDPTYSHLANSVVVGAPTLARPNMLMSRDNGKTWERPQEGFPLFPSHPDQTAHIEVRVAPWDPDVLFAASYNPPATLLADPDAPPSWFSFFKSTDGGRTWSELSPEPSLDDPTGRVPGWTHFLGPDGYTRTGIDFEVDPIDKNVLWAIFAHPWHNDGVWRSADGGATWTEAVSPGLFPHSCNPDSGKARYQNINVAHRSGEPATLVLFESLGGYFEGAGQRECMIRSDDGGRTWHYPPELPAWTHPLTGQRFNLETDLISHTTQNRFAFLGGDLKLYREVGGGRRWASLRHPFSNVVKQQNGGKGWGFWQIWAIEDFRRRPALYLFETQDGSAPEGGGIPTIWKYQGRW